MHSSDVNKLLSSEELAKVRAYAIRSHGDQAYGERAYSYHLDMVVAAIATSAMCTLEDLKAGYATILRKM